MINRNKMEAKLKVLVSKLPLIDSPLHCEKKCREKTFNFKSMFYESFLRIQSEVQYEADSPYQ